MLIQAPLNSNVKYWFKGFLILTAFNRITEESELEQLKISPEDDNCILVFEPV